MGSFQEKIKPYNDWPNDQGFNVKYEERSPVELNVSGTIPAYAAGTLYRTGCSVNEIETAKDKTFRVSHWFDELAQVHRFQILPPDKDHPSVRVLYNSRSSCDGLIEKIRKTGNREEITFGRKYDPCMSFFQKIMSIFLPERHDSKAQPDERSMSVTVSVNFPGLTSVGTKTEQGHSSGIQTLVSKTDNSGFQMLNLETLEPVGLADQKVLHPSLKGPSSATHAKSDPATGDVYNYNLEFGRRATYRVFHVSASTGKCSILATIPNADAAYLHSLFLTKHYVIVCVWNSFFAMGGAKIMWDRNIIDALADYDPSRPARWYVVDRRPPSSGGLGLIATYESDPFFCFHTINAYEEPSLTNGKQEGEIDIIADLVAYDNLDCLKRNYISNLLSTSPSAAAYADPSNTKCRPALKRFRLPANPTTKKQTTQTTTLKAPCEFTADKMSTPELPTLSSRVFTDKHRYIYGVTETGKSTFLDGLVKHDVQTHEATFWSEHGQSAGEPIFIPRPAGKHSDGDAGKEEEEDDGVLLSVVLDGIGGKSYLLVLDAKSMTEVGRASMNGVVGFGFHGTYVPAARRDGRGLDY